MLHTFHKVRVEAIIGASGSESIDVAQICQSFMEEKKARRLVQNLGFKHVRQLAYPKTTADLCGQATLRLFEQQSIDPSSIDGFIFVTQNPDYMVPANTYVWQPKLGLSAETLMLDIIQGCSGYVYGLFYAAVLIESGLCRRVLLCAGDTSCDARNVAKMQQPANVALFGDGGSATLLCRSATDMPSYFSIQNNGELSDVIKGDKYSSKRFRAVERDEQGEPPKPQGTKINGVELASYAMDTVKGDIERLLQYAGFSYADIAYIIAHQANKNLLKSMSMGLSIAPSLLPFLAENTGNTSSASIPLALSENHASLPLLRQRPALLCGFGVGMSVASALIDLKQTVILDPVFL